MKKIFSLKWLSGNTLIVAVIALFKFILSMAFSGSYGYFRDELYYIACSDHLDWGYVDQPPLSIFILKISRWMLGDSLPAIRFTAVLAGVVVVIIAGLIARKLGGGRFAQGFAAASALMSPVILGNAGRYFSMNAFDLLFWSLAFYVLISIIKENKPKLWPVFGLIAGLGLMNKYSILFLGIGLIAGLLLTSERKQLINKWFWIAAAVVLLVILPHIIWEIQHDFPSIEFIRNASTEKNVGMTFMDF
jgi:4-amino-4-deoxy-L-arabinose transferase-like glycosyltransferase